MFIAVYEMKAKQGREKEFEAAWAAVTDAIHKHRGSLGSRLHKTEEERLYVAYAQWPSREVYYDESTENLFTKDEKAQRVRMRDAAEFIKTAYLLDVIDDRLTK
ncbi:MAG: antibiotic biosynthesis monooxygenase [Candidatus Zixiibacteriota bacterium]